MTLNTTLPHTLYYTQQCWEYIRKPGQFLFLNQELGHHLHHWLAHTNQGEPCGWLGQNQPCLKCPKPSNLPSSVLQTTIIFQHHPLPGYSPTCTCISLTFLLLTTCHLQCTCSFATIDLAHILHSLSLPFLTSWIYPSPLLVSPFPYSLVSLSQNVTAL